MSAAGTVIAGGAVIGAGQSRRAASQARLAANRLRQPHSPKSTCWSSAAGRRGSGPRSARRAKGRKTLLIENHSFFGGVAAWALGMPINQMRPGGKPRSAVHELLIEKLKAYGDQAVRLGKHEVWCNVEYLKVAVLDALDEVGCRYLVHVRAADAIVENNRVAGVVVATKAGLDDDSRQGRGGLHRRCRRGLLRRGRDDDRPDALMPMTLSLALTNIDKTKVRSADVGEGHAQGPREASA